MKATLIVRYTNSQHKPYCFNCECSTLNEAIDKYKQIELPRYLKFNNPVSSYEIAVFYGDV